ncbi:MAG TPA: alpha/beta hydrolase [Spirochaetota bacterium]|nr:alpha/beta hydrolase [Spirochaetota bacterium]HQF06824.1 alpha/beta hydrolase [Spirochaetota bacterium]HQH95557.1 alpha/beta hydrolase [Spirochaetota bacterium]
MQGQTVIIDYKNSRVQLAVKLKISGNQLLFFIHGLGCAKENFDGVWTNRNLKDYSIMVPDLPGFGDSPGLADFSYDLEDHAGICKSLLDCYPQHTVHVIGHSMGGAVGLILGERIPGRLASFSNVEGNLIGHDCTVSRNKASVSFEEFEKRQLPGMILATAMSAEPGRRLWSVLLKKADTKGLYYSSRSLVTWSGSGVLLEKFRNISCKKVYIHGDNNSSMPVLRRLEGIPVHSISKSGHFPMNDNPEEFYKYISDFIKD